MQWASSILSAGSVTEQGPRLLRSEIHHHVCTRATSAMGSPSPWLSVVGILRKAYSQEMWDFSKGRLAWWRPTGLAKLFLGLLYGPIHLRFPTLLPPLPPFSPPSPPFFLPSLLHLGLDLHFSLAAVLISTSFLSIFSHRVFSNKFITYLILYQLIGRSELTQGKKEGILE